jgi:hypothetical protein
LFTLLHDNEARLSSIGAYLRKRNVVLSHCYNSANVIEPREPHACNNKAIQFGDPFLCIIPVSILYIALQEHCSLHFRNRIKTAFIPSHTSTEPTLFYSKQ